MKIALRTFGLIGIILFGTAFWFTFGVPGYVENQAKEFIKSRIEKETNEKIDSLALAAKDSKLGKFAQKLMDTNQEEISQIQASLQAQLHEKIAAVIAEMADLDCECRDKYAQLIKSGFESRLLSLKNSNEKLLDFMKTKYMEVASKLTLDLRIFTGSNLVIFLLLLAISLMKPKVITHLFLPGILLLLSTTICSYFYLFQQNWFFTIIFNNYVGFGYLAYVAILFGIFCDIAFNKARITTEIINCFLNAIGSAATVLPC